MSEVSDNSHSQPARFLHPVTAVTTDANSLPGYYFAMFAFIVCLPFYKSTINFKEGLNCQAIVSKGSPYGKRKLVSM